MGKSVVVWIVNGVVKKKEFPGEKEAAQWYDADGPKNSQYRVLYSGGKVFKHGGTDDTYRDKALASARDLIGFDKK